MPSDVEIVAGIFTALLDYSVNHKKNHLFDDGFSEYKIKSLNSKDIGLVNKQPKSIYRAHFEYISYNKSRKTPSVSLYLINQI